MPAQLAPASPGITVPKYSIVGQYISGKSGNFVQHVALAREEGLVFYGHQVSVWGMQPPLVAGQRSASRTKKDAICETHLVGWLTLTADEKEAIADWLAEIDKEDRPSEMRRFPEQYTVSIREEDKWHNDENGVRLYRRFSCISFVLSAYSDGANIELLDISDPNQLPIVDLNTLAATYGEHVRTHEQIRIKIGLAGSGPWRVLLPGYVYHALNRSESTIRNAPFAVQDLAAAKFPVALPPRK